MPPFLNPFPERTNLEDGIVARSAPEHSTECYKQALRQERAAWDAVLQRSGPLSKGLGSLRRASLAANDARTVFLETMGAPPEQEVSQKTPAVRTIASLRIEVRDAVQEQRAALATLERSSRSRGMPHQDLVLALEHAIRKVDAARRALWHARWQMREQEGRTRAP